MKYKEDYVGSKKECLGFLSESLTKLLKNDLMVDQQVVEIPEDRLIEYTVKYENDEIEGTLGLKISWMNVDEVEEEEEEEVDEVDEVDEEE